MKCTSTQLKDCYIIQPRVFEDERGYFFESFNHQKFTEVTGLDIQFIQDNEAKSNRGVLRGLHFQKGDFAQAKLVRVTQGKVLDVVVDMRKKSPSYLQHFSVELSQENKTQLFVPRGFAHGYVVLEDHTVFNYKCDNYYAPKEEGGIKYDDAYLKINWQLNSSEIIISEKDARLPYLKLLA